MEGEEAEFTVSLTGTRTGTVSVTYSTADGTAQAPDDYTANTSGTLTFETNETSKTIRVPTIDDNDEEQTETFTVSLSSPSSGVTIPNPMATGTINDETAEAAEAAGARGVVEAAEAVVEAAVVVVGWWRRREVEVAAPSLPCPSRTPQRARATPPSSSSP